MWIFSKYWHVCITYWTSLVCSRMSLADAYQMKEKSSYKDYEKSLFHFLRNSTNSRHMFSVRYFGFPYVTFVFPTLRPFSLRYGLYAVTPRIHHTKCRICTNYMYGLSQVCMKDVSRLHCRGKLEPVFVKDYALNICFPKYGQICTVP